MKTETMTISKGNIVIVIYDVAKGQKQKIKDVCYTTLDRLEDIMTVPAEKLQDDIKKEFPLAGTPAGALKSYRFREGLTQMQLAKKTGMKQSHISEMEKGKRTIGLTTAKKLAKVLNCRWERLVG